MHTHDLAVLALIAAVLAAVTVAFWRDIVRIIVVILIFLVFVGLLTLTQPGSGPPLGSWTTVAT